MNTRQHVSTFCRGGRILLAGVTAVALSAGAAQAQKTLIIGLETDLAGFDPLKAHVLGISANTAAVLIMERMTELDDDGNLRRVLSVSSEESDDGKTWTVKIRKGVKWHDGADFTADDYVNYMKHLLNPKNRYFGRLFMSQIKGVSKVDDETAQLHLHYKYIPASFPDAYSFTSFIAPMKYLGKDGKHHRSPVGTGPFVFKEWRSGDRLIVEKNPHHRDADKVKLDRIVLRFLPDPQTRFASLQSGEVDIIWTDRGSSILAAEKDPKLVVHKREGRGAGITFLNTAKPPFDDVNARRAVAHAWNQKVYIKVSRRGTQTAIEHPLGPDIKCDVGFRKPSVKEAKKYAAMYQAKHGKPLAFEYIHTSTQRGREGGEIMQQLAKKAGIVVKLSPVDQLQLRQKVFTNNYNYSGWRIADTPEVNSQLFALLYSKSFYNLTRYKNPDMDKLVFAMNASKTREDYNKNLCAVAAKVNDDAMILWSHGRRHHAISRKGALSNVPPLWQGTIDPRFIVKN